VWYKIWDVVKRMSFAMSGAKSRNEWSYRPGRGLRRNAERSNEESTDQPDASVQSERISRVVPTIIVASLDEALRSFFLRNLAQGSRHVLEADSEDSLLDLIKLHSRPIQVLLVDIRLDNRDLLASLRKYRPNMAIIPVAEDLHEPIRGVLTPRAALMKAEGLTSALPEGRQT
jgi:hypothetical protein